MGLKNGRRVARRPFFCHFSKLELSQHGLHGGINHGDKVLKSDPMMLNDIMR